MSEKFRADGSTVLLWKFSTYAASEMICVAFPDLSLFYCDQNTHGTLHGIPWGVSYERSISLRLAPCLASHMSFWKVLTCTVWTHFLICFLPLENLLLLLFFTWSLWRIFIQQDMKLVQFFRAPGKSFLKMFGDRAQGKLCKRFPSACMKNIKLVNS